MGARTTVGARELKIRLGSYLRAVRGGQTLVVTDRGHPVAELRPISGGGGALAERLRELAALGIVSSGGKGRGTLPPFTSLIGQGGLMSEAISEDREDRF